MKYLKETPIILKQIFNRLKNRDFSGNAGIAMKNSLYQLSTNFSSKILSFVFTIILARILMPELFGLYSLALSTILFFAAFADLGFGETIVRFISKGLGKNNPAKAAAYSKHIIKIKISLMLIVSLLLILLSKLIAENYYNKPIGMALLAGGIYIFIAGFVIIFQSILQAHNLFRPIFYRELLFQIIRIIGVPLFVIFALKNSFDNEIILSGIITIFTFAYLLSAIMLYFFYKKNVLNKEIKEVHISGKEKKKINSFFKITSLTFLSGILIGYIDIIMLGYFVTSEYIGYYQGAFTFISTLIPIITFSAALLPVFSRLDRRKMEYIFKKVAGILTVISVIAFLFILFASKYLILIAFGEQYAASINVLRIFSLILLPIPLITLYSTYFTSAGKPEIVSKSAAISIILNIALDYLFISYLVQFSQIYAIYGAAAATIISRYFYALLLVFYKKKIIK